jgi:ABC-2 type transport system permease protein
VILVVGATTGGYTEVRLGVVVHDSGPLATDLVRELRAVSGVTTYRDDDSARTAVRRGERDGAVVVPAGFDAALGSGRTTDLALVTAGDPGAQQAVTALVSAAVGRQAARVQAAGFAAAHVGGTARDHLATAAGMQERTRAATVRIETAADGAGQILPRGFGYSAPTMLVLFVFVNAVAGGAALIQTRSLGVHARILAAPVRPRSIVLGAALCYTAMAMLQSVLIVGVGAAVFGVRWGDPWAAAALVTVWALVGAGAGMLSGTVFRTAEQATAIGPAVGMALGMLGGCMWPLAIVSPAMRTVGHFAPHAWAVDAWTTLLARSGHLSDIVVPLLVLAGVAVGLLALSAVRLRRRLLA